MTDRTHAGGKEPAIDPANEHRQASGTQFGIAFDVYAATVAEVGAAVRELRAGDRDVFLPCEESELCEGYHGAVLVPWPNRLADGRFTFDGDEHQLPVTEPARMTALHGLSPWRRWTALDHQADRVTLRLQLLPSPGYPFSLDTVVEYRVGPGGLRVTTTSRNAGDRPCPYAVGFHPYLSAGTGCLDECTLSLDATRRFRADERLLPIGEEDVAATAYDFRAPRAIGALVVDDAFTGVTRDPNGLAWARLRGPDGLTAAIWMDASCDYWQLCTADMLPASHARRGLAAEPMSAAPDAFRTSRGLRRLEAGDEVTTVWGACLM